MPKNSEIEKFDTVQLSKDFDERMLFTVCSTADAEGIVRMFPKDGGMHCSAHKDNLVITDKASA